MSKLGLEEEEVLLTTEQIFLLRNIIEQSTEWQSSIYINFVDFVKVLDSVHRDRLWAIMKYYGITDTFARIIKLLYTQNVQSVMEEKSQRGLKLKLV